MVFPLCSYVWSRNLGMVSLLFSCLVTQFRNGITLFSYVWLPNLGMISLLFSNVWSPNLGMVSLLFSNVWSPNLEMVLLLFWYVWSPNLGKVLLLFSYVWSPNLEMVLLLFYQILEYRVHWFPLIHTRLKPLFKSTISGSAQICEACEIWSWSCPHTVTSS